MGSPLQVGQHFLCEAVQVSSVWQPNHLAVATITKPGPYSLAFWEKAKRLGTLLF
jgi:hypothetical protein